MATGSTACSKALPRRAVFATLAGLLTFTPLLADDDHGEREHDRIRRAVERGQAKSLSELRHIVLSRVDGTIVDTRIDHDQSGMIYEFRVLRADGHVIEVEVDGVSGHIREVEND